MHYDSVERAWSVNGGGRPYIYIYIYTYIIINITIYVKIYIYIFIRQTLRSWNVHAPKTCTQLSSVQVPTLEGSNCMFQLSLCISV